MYSLTTRLHFLQKFWRILISDKKVSEYETVRNLSVSEIFTVQYKISCQVSPNLLVSFMRRTLVETLFKIRNGLIELVFLSPRYRPIYMLL